MLCLVDVKAQALHLEHELVWCDGGLSAPMRKGMTLAAEVMSKRTVPSLTESLSIMCFLSSVLVRVEIPYLFHRDLTTQNSPAGAFYSYIRHVELVETTIHSSSDSAQDDTNAKGAQF